MLKKFLITVTLVLILLGVGTGLCAQGVLMNSAETIQTGNFKVAIFPTLLLGKNGSDSAFGVAGRAGYGLTSSFDIEIKGAFFKGLNYLGIDAEYWFLKGPQFNLSVSLGGHMTNVDLGVDSAGIDTALIVSTRPSQNLEIYGGLMLAFDSFKDMNYNHTLIHVVPGIEYRLSDELDFLAEFGLALNDNSRSYISAGFAYYFLR